MRRGKSKNNHTEKIAMLKEMSEEEDSSDEDPRDYFTLRTKMKAQSKQQKNQERDEDPVSLLQNYTNENYNEHIKLIKQYLDNEKPFTYADPELDRFIRLGANICVYGYGSKKDFLMGLARTHYPDNYIWEVNGYLSTTHAKKVYNHFGAFLKEARIAEEIKKTTYREQILEYNEILQEYSKKKGKPLVVVFHCLDGQHFSEVDEQRKLAKLLTLPCVRLICSIDNIKISTMWPPSIKEAYKFVFFNVNTKIPNIYEQIYKPVSTERTHLVEQSLMNIYESLNSNQKRILKIITKNELTNLEKGLKNHLTTSELLEICIDEVILSDDVQLRQNLFELIDHKVLIEKMDEVKNRKVVMIKYEKSLLEKIMALRIQ